MIFNENALNTLAELFPECLSLWYRSKPEARAEFDKTLQKSIRIKNKI